MKTNHIILGVIVLLAAYLRFEGLGSHDLWIDEVSYTSIARGLNLTQETVPVLIGWLYLPSTEFWTRFPFALSGTLTVLALYFVFRDKRLALSIAFFVAVFPLMVFWSRMARPYAIAGLFMVLSWRWWWAQLLAILSTPIALIGTNVWTKQWDRLAFILVVAVILYFIREDYARGHWTVQNMVASSRWFYLPILAGVLHLGRVLDAPLCPRRRGKNLVF